MAGGTLSGSRQIACKRLIKDQQAFNQLLRPSCFIAAGFTRLVPSGSCAPAMGSAYPCRSSTPCYQQSNVTTGVARADFCRGAGLVGSGLGSAGPAVCPQQGSGDRCLNEGIGLCVGLPNSSLLGSWCGAGTARLQLPGFPGKKLPGVRRGEGKDTGLSPGGRRRR